MIHMLQLHENTYKCKKTLGLLSMQQHWLNLFVMGMQELLTAAPAEGEPAGAIITFFFPSKAYIFIFYVTLCKFGIFCVILQLYKGYT